MAASWQPPSLPYLQLPGEHNRWRILTELVVSSPAGRRGKFTHVPPPTSTPCLAPRYPLADTQRQKTTFKIGHLFFSGKLLDSGAKT